MVSVRWLTGRAAVATCAWLLLQSAGCGEVPVDLVLSRDGGVVDTEAGATSCPFGSSEQEPNQTAATATPLPDDGACGEVVANDVDVFAITIGAASTLKGFRVTLRDDGGSIDAVLTQTFATDPSRGMNGEKVARALGAAGESGTIGPLPSGFFTVGDEYTLTLRAEDASRLRYTIETIR